MRLPEDRRSPALYRVIPRRKGLCPPSCDFIQRDMATNYYYHDCSTMYHVPRTTSSEKSMHRQKELHRGGS